METMLSEHHMLRTPLMDPTGGLSQLTAEERAVLAARSQLFLRAAAAAAAVSGPYGPLCGIYNAAAAAGSSHLWNQWASLGSQVNIYQQLAAAGGGGGGGGGSGGSPGAAGPTGLSPSYLHHQHQQQQQQQQQAAIAAAAAGGNGFRFSPYLLPSHAMMARSPPLSSPDTGSEPVSPLSPRAAAPQPQS